MPDVVVIGAGCAGLAAAIAAGKAGASVTVLSKTAAESASCTSYSAGLFSLACGTVSPEEQYSSLLTVGRGLNDRSLLRVLTEESAGALEELSSLGLTVSLKNGRASVRKTAKNGLMGGSGMTTELISIAKALGVRFMEWSVARSIKIKNGRAVGVSVTGWRTGRHEAVPADAVVLAAGGAGRVYSHTDNPERMTGDGYALAAKAGVRLRDMEFVQFYPIGWAQEGFPMWMADAALGDYIRITDNEGEEFIKEAYKRWGIRDGAECNSAARDKLAILMAEKDMAGGVFAHIEEADERLWSDGGFLYAITLPPELFRDIKKPLRVAPLEHYFCGGAEIGTSGETCVDGLYICGETAGGIDGANRMGGNALAHCVTFGLRAGRAAAAHPAEAPEFFKPEDTVCGASRSGIPVREARRELQERAWRAIGPVRRPEQLMEFLNWLGGMKKEKLRADTRFEQLLAFEMEGLTFSAEAVAEAALKRKESVGSHYIAR